MAGAAGLAEATGGLVPSAWLAARPVVAEASGDRAGCGSVDPTDPANYSTITIVNDTPGIAVVDDCVGTECLTDRLPVRPAPAQRYSDHAACGASGADMTS